MSHSKHVCLYRKEKNISERCSFLPVLMENWKVIQATNNEQHMPFPAKRKTIKTHLFLNILCESACISFLNILPLSGQDLRVILEKTTNVQRNEIKPFYLFACYYYHWPPSTNVHMFTQNSCLPSGPAGLISPRDPLK